MASEIIFSLFDVDGNSVVDVNDLTAMFNSLGFRLIDNEISEIIKEWDVDKDNALNKEEFGSLVEMAFSLDKNENEKAMYSAFKKMDLDNDGVLRMDDITQCAAMIGMTSREAENMILIENFNENSYITYEDFRNILMEE